MTDTLLQPEVAAPEPVPTPRADQRSDSTGRAFGLALPAFAAAIGALVGSGKLSDNSFLTHLATGRLILDHGFPHSDPYTFTAGGEPWVVQSWFASVLYGFADKLGDLGGVRVLTVVLAAAVSLVCWRLTKPATAPVLRLAVWIPAVVVGTGFWVERPLLIGLLLLGLALVAADPETGMDRRWLLLVGWVWLNSHGSWPLGLVALATLALGRRLDGDARGASAAVAAMKWLVGSLVLGSINPYGPRLLVFPVELLSRKESLQLVEEWKAPRFDSPSQWAFLLLVLLAIVGLQRRRSWATTLPLVVFTAAALLGARNIPVAALAVLPGLAASFQGLGGFSTRLVARQGRLVGLAAVAMSVIVVTGLAGDGGAFDARTYPVAAVDYLESVGRAPNEVRVVSEGTTGNYLEARYGAGSGAFIDDRIEVLPKPVIDDYLVLLGGGRDWEDVLDRYDAEVVLWSRSAPLAQLLALSPEWKQTYADARFVVFVRVGAAGPEGATGD